MANKKIKLRCPRCQRVAPVIVGLCKSCEAELKKQRADITEPTDQKEE
jgi:hypothetical protein